ncbi:MAG: dTMP kinase [Deltaproteobacteria bacterium]
MIEGHFIVIEGIDGAGTTTQCGLLARALRKRGLPVHPTREPSDGPIGTMIRQILQGRIVVPGAAGPRAPGWATMALLFAADRVDHLDAEIFPNLIDGVTVISDRYDYSSVGYQSFDVAAPDAMDWIRKINGRARRPDLTVVIDVRAELAAKRVRERSGRPELYEHAELQGQLVGFYRDLEKHFPGERIVHVEGDAEPDAVCREILSHVDALRAMG